MYGPYIGTGNGKLLDMCNESFIVSDTHLGQSLSTTFQPIYAFIFLLFKPNEDKPPVDRLIQT